MFITLLNFQLNASGKRFTVLCGLINRKNIIFNELLNRADWLAFIVIITFFKILLKVVLQDVMTYMMVN